MSYLGQQLGQGQAERFVYTASGGETSVTTSDDGRAIAYTVGQVDVYLNGAKLINGSDFTATTGTSITGLAALTASDVVEVFALSIFQASDTVSAASGGTFNGNVTVDANLSVTGTVDINGGNIDGTVIGAATPAAGSFTTGQFGTSLNVDGTVTADGLTVDGDVLITTNTATNPFVVSRVGNTTESLQITFDDSNTILTSEQDEAGRYGGYVFNSKNAGTTIKRMEIAHTSGDISFYEDTGTTPKFFWDASAESLGIGTTSPVGGVHSQTASAGVNANSNFRQFVAENSGNAGITILSGASSLGTLVFGDSGSSTVGRVQYDHSNDSLAFSNNNSEAMRIDSSGNVGIGTTSPAERLSIYKGISYNADSALFSTIEVNDSAVNNNAVYRWRTGITGNATGHSYTFSTQARTQGSYVERMRIDSSGNLLVGGTVDHGGRLSLTAGSSQHGTVIASNGSITGGAESGGMAEGVVDVDTTSLGTVLSIPITSQPSRWRRFVIQFMFSSGEYNLNSNSKSGTATVSFASLTSLTTLSLLDSTGNVASVSASGTTLQINFTSGFTSGTSNWEGVHVYYKILSATPSYIQMWNATLN